MQHNGDQNGPAADISFQLLYIVGNPQIVTHGNPEDGMGRNRGEGPEQLRFANPPSITYITFSTAAKPRETKTAYTIPSNFSLKLGLFHISR